VKSDRAISLTLILVSIFASNTRAVTSSERSVSPSGQFIIYGGDAASRGAVSALAERTKSNLLAVLKRRDDWKIRFIINLQTRAPNVPELPATEFRLSQTESGLKLQLDLTFSREINGAAIERELARVILLEMIYRNQTGIASGDVYVDPPSWLIDGLLAAVPNRSHTALVAALSVPQRDVSLADFLGQRPESLDSPATELYRGYSFVLVQSLLESANGCVRLGHYIDNLASASSDSFADLRAAFPEIRDWDKIWKSKIAQVKASPDNGLLKFAQSEERLSEILDTKFPTADGREKSLSFEDFSRTKPNATQRLALQKFGQQLLLLAEHANPLLRPVIQDYQQIVGQLILGKSRGIPTRLAELKTLRARLSAQMSEVDDYMNWFEAAKLETPSGMFDDYLKSASARRALTPKRKDPLSVCLDAVEQEF
jgi:hypothetical protein